MKLSLAEKTTGWPAAKEDILKLAETLLPSHARVAATQFRSGLSKHRASPPIFEVSAVTPYDTFGAWDRCVSASPRGAAPA